MIEFIVSCIVLSAVIVSVLSYGIKLGKAMQKELPPSPVDEVKNVTLRVVKGIKNKTYTRKVNKAEKEEFNVFD